MNWCHSTISHAWTVRDYNKPLLRVINLRPGRHTRYRKWLNWSWHLSLGWSRYCVNVIFFQSIHFFNIYHAIKYFFKKYDIQNSMALNCFAVNIYKISHCAFGTSCSLTWQWIQPGRIYYKDVIVLRNDFAIIYIVCLFRWNWITFYMVIVKLLFQIKIRQQKHIEIRSFFYYFPQIYHGSNLTI